MSCYNIYTTTEHGVVLIVAVPRKVELGHKQGDIKGKSTTLTGDSPCSRGGEVDGGVAGGVRRRVRSQKTSFKIRN